MHTNIKKLKGHYIISKSQAQRKQIAKDIYMTIKNRSGWFLKLNFDTCLIEELEEEKVILEICHEFRKELSRIRNSIDQSSEHNQKLWFLFKRWIY